MENITNPLFILAVRLVACMMLLKKASGAKKIFLHRESEHILLQLSLLEILVTPYCFSDAKITRNEPDAFRFTGNDIQFEIYSHSDAVNMAIATLMSH